LEDQERAVLDACDGRIGLDYDYVLVWNVPVLCFHGRVHGPGEVHRAIDHEWPRVLDAYGAQVRLKVRRV
jgi:hypothetical protein